ncbi:MAG: sensor histidine kinase [Candidatus Electrothrix sp. GM3_4]|nr:sensor histidine kinase [Candidatus Electrothrix sp. GM3_4]
MSYNKTLLTRIGHEAFVVTSDVVLDENDSVLGYLMLASQLTSDFIYASVQGMNRKNLIALIDNKTGRVIADNNPNIKLIGTREDKLTQQYHVFGKSFFDYGASDLDAHFLSLIPKEHYQKMGRKILKAARWSRAMTGTVILACLCVILFIVTRRIDKVISRIDEFAEKELHTAIISGRTGDQLLVLEERFLVLGQQMIETRNNLQEQVAKRTKEYQATNYLLENEIKERICTGTKLKAMLAEKETLLKEIHHRVKNNMQIVASLMFLQAQNTKSTEALDILQESQDRIKSMSLVHELLYQSGNLSRVPFKEYIETLVSSLRQSYDAHDVLFEIEAESIGFSVDTAVPCGLIVNELVTNSFKHAFQQTVKEEGLCSGSGSGILSVRFTRENGACLLSVSDNGSGFPEDYDWDSSNTLGLNLIRTLANQLDAELEFENQDGLTCRLRFSV